MKNLCQIKQSVSLTDIGVKRSKNEDFHAALPDCGFFAIADGMGGHRAGEVAAQEAVNYLCNAVKELLITTSSGFEKEIRRIYENANDWIYRLSRTNEAFFGMGTTLCSLLILKDKLIFGHIGDSRIYCLRQKRLHQITLDHVAMIREKGRSHQKRKVLTQVIGSSKFIEPQIGQIAIQTDDIYLICSDGLSDFVSQEYIQLILNSRFTLQDRVSLLIETAKQQGSKDNITIIAIEV